MGLAHTVDPLRDILIKGPSQYHAANTGPCRDEQGWHVKVFDSIKH